MSRALVNHNYATPFIAAVNSLPTSVLHKQWIAERYIPLLEETLAKRRLSRICNFSASIISLIFGIIVAALLTLDPARYAWACWVMTVIVTIAGQSAYEFDFSRIYLYSTIICDKLISEGWKYVAGIGDYTSDDLDERFALFANKVEKIYIMNAETEPNMDTHGELNEIINMSAGPHGSIVERLGEAEQLGEVVVDVPIQVQNRSTQV